MIARVFPTWTSMAPNDPDAYFNGPDMFTPKYDEIHISVTFTWDIDKAKRLAKEWDGYGKIRIGGVAIDGESKTSFIAGRYLKKGITITTRGCPFACEKCQVNKKQFIELDDFPVGNIIQDNNILASSKTHWDKVMAMLKTQKGVAFKGGLDKRLLTSERLDDIRSLRIRELWMACDSRDSMDKFATAMKMVRKAGFPTWKVFAFAIIGDNMEENEDRLRFIFNQGAIPFAQLYRNVKDDIKYSKKWKQFAKTWSRPASIKAVMKLPPKEATDEA